MRLGLPRQYLGEGLDAGVADRLGEAVSRLKGAGVDIIEVELPHTEQVIAAYYVIADAEASANLARYDGIRYGRRARAEELKAAYCRSRSEGLGKEVKRRIMLGTFVLSAGYYEAYYERAQKVRRLIRRDFEQVFEQVDLLLTPTTPTTAFKLGEKTADPLSMYLADVYTAAVNLAGLPAMSLPCGTDSGGLPIGLQLIGPEFAEASLFRFAALVQRVI
jgi:aspartyl-tRNA(Asn)/glutamyl-tRNA(Gln) amidotransferase subunit A